MKKCRAEEWAKLIEKDIERGIKMSNLDTDKMFVSDPACGSNRWRFKMPFPAIWLEPFGKGSVDEKQKKTAGAKFLYPTCITVGNGIRDWKIWFTNQPDVFSTIHICFHRQEAIFLLYPQKKTQQWPQQTWDSHFTLPKVLFFGLGKVFQKSFFFEREKKCSTSCMARQEDV